ncbi:MAG: hypothetical protein H9W81_07670 [Enterococcus sp.]|nr:hypothetical protein [Enterococcus sp.]
MENHKQDTRTIMVWLKESSGLSPEQLGRLLGVTRRAIHNWAGGSPIAGKHELRIRALREMVLGLDASTPEERRVLMMESRGGSSLFQDFLISRPRLQRTEYPIPVIERFGGAGS